MMYDLPIIKTFIHNKKYYCYDACLNQLFNVSKRHYSEICKLHKIGISEYQKLNKTDTYYKDIITLINKGLFSSSFINTIEHIDTKNLHNLTARCINQLILGITNSCNFKCRYCHQAEGKVLSSAKIMSTETAFRSVDFLYEHSKDAFEVTITFYGGEPLLNFELIKSTVQYANNKFKTKEVMFNMTTNASILNNEIIDFLVENKFYLLISLDGKRETQNLHRKYLNNGKNTFDPVWKNITNIRKKHPLYFASHIQFNAVVLQDENPNDVLMFFEKNNISKETVHIRRADMNGIDYYISPISLKNNTENNILIEDMYKTALEHYLDKSAISNQWHHNGPCIPAVRRLFVNADEEFYPCEKIDSDPSCLLGTLNKGINIEKAKEIMNIGRLTEQECKKCWAVRFCTMCAFHCIDNGILSRSIKLENCKLQKKNALLFFKKYTEIK